MENKIRYSVTNMAWNEIIILYSHFHVVDVDGTGNATLFSCIISYMFHVKFWHRFLISIESSPTYLRHLLISCKISWLKRTNNARRNKFKNHRFSNSWIRPRLSITLSLDNLHVILVYILENSRNIPSIFSTSAWIWVSWRHIDPSLPKKKLSKDYGTHLNAQYVCHTCGNHIFNTISIPFKSYTGLGWHPCTSSICPNCDWNFDQNNKNNIQQIDRWVERNQSLLK